MAGRIILVSPKRVFDFSGAPVGSTASVIAADRVDVVQWRELTLIARVHAMAIDPLNQIQVNVLQQSWTPEEPSMEFVNLNLPQGVILNSGLTPPAMTSVQLNAEEVTGIVRIVVVGIRNSSGPLSATVSIDFSAKDS